LIDGVLDGFHDLVTGVHQVSDEFDVDMTSEIVTFIQEYADGRHHEKEERVLTPASRQRAG